MRFFVKDDQSPRMPPGSTGVILDMMYCTPMEVISSVVMNQVVYRSLSLEALLKEPERTLLSKKGYYNFALCGNCAKIVLILV